MRRYGLSDSEWDQIKNLLPGRSETVGVTAKDNRLFVEAILYRYRTGIPWRDLPARFGNYRSVHMRHSRWSRKGVWEKIFQVLSTHSDNTYTMIDSTIVKAHQHSAGAKKKRKRQSIGRSSGGWSSKIHVICDGQGKPTALHLTAGNSHDLVGSDALLMQIQSTTLIADKAYYARDRFIEKLKARKCKVVIPPKVNSKTEKKYDKIIYKRRHLIENFFAKLKQFRAIATRYDKTAKIFLGAIHLVASLSWTI
ncbi:IS5 family transposase [Candidatus Cardinium hertigii]|uniref:IS5 family transposase n=1 Tax=Candidatus Cardinium hertigii TaxID=247481 RepID=A0A3N2QB48_9BACT|nr:IS5 family transposase [Candidatus Cardinium hertigii]